MREKEASQKNTIMKLNDRNLILQHIHKTGFTNGSLLFVQSEVVVHYAFEFREALL
jgi:hypothetical protein